MTTPKRLRTQHSPHGAPDVSRLDTQHELADAIVYYAERASRVNPNGASRRMLRELLRLYDLRVAELVARARWK